MISLCQNIRIFLPQRAIVDWSVDGGDSSDLRGHRRECARLLHHPLYGGEFRDADIRHFHLQSY